MLARAKDLANNEDLSSDVGFQLNLTLANVSIKHAEHLLAATEADAAVDIGEAIGLLNAANEVIANLSAEDDDPATESKEAAANQMQAQVIVISLIVSCTTRPHDLQALLLVGLTVRPMQCTSEANSIANAVSS